MFLRINPETNEKVKPVNSIRKILRRYFFICGILNLDIIPSDPFPLSNNKYDKTIDASEGKITER